MRSYKCGLGGRFGWMSHTKIGLSPRRLLFMSRVKPKVNVTNLD